MGAIARRAAALAILVGTYGCARTGISPSDGPEPVALDPWVLECRDPGAKAPAWLSNGLIGVRIGRDGSGVDPPSGGFFSIDDYESAGEEKLRPYRQNPLQTNVTVSSRPRRPDRMTGYSQRLHMRTGILETRYRLGSGASVVIETTLHPTKRIVGQKWTLKMPPGEELRALFVFTLSSPGDPVGHPVDSLWRVGPFGAKMHARCRAAGLREENWTFTASGVRLVGRAGPSGEVVIERSLSFGASPNQLNMNFVLTGAETRSQPGWDEPPPCPAYTDLAAESARIWSERWKTDIEIDGPAEDQQAVRSFLFYLWMSIHPDGGMSVSPFALSNAAYNGHVFWDADVWMFPALALLDPRRAKALVDYRQERVIQAMRNVFETFPDADPLAAIAKFPWESAVTGKEVAPKSHRGQIHVTGSVAWSMMLAAALGLCDPTDAELATGDAANLFRRFSVRGKNGGREIRRVFGPAERTVDNDLYTNLLAQYCENGGGWEDRPGAKPDRYYLPRDSVTFLTYDGDDLKTYQQASAVLAIYPLQYPQAEREARRMMERFESKIIENGPAMSDSIHAVIWARLGEGEKAYDRWRESWRRYATHPLLLFSEKPKVERTYFVTGAAGCLQAVLYGFLGFRIDSKYDPGAAWSRPLKGGKYLTVRPHLPKAWKRVTLRNFTVLGRRATLTVTHASARVEEAAR